MLQPSGCVNICLPVWKDVKPPKSGAKQLSSPTLSLTSRRTTLSKSYRLISLLCIPFKLFERMIHGGIKPISDPQLPHEQAGFRKGQPTVDQVTLLTQDIEDCFEAKETAGTVLFDLTAAYDTVWHRGLTLKLLRMLPDRHMVHFIVELISNCSLCLRPAMDSKAGYADSRTAFPKDLSWLHCCLISTSMTSLIPSPGSMAMPMTWPS